MVNTEMQTFRRHGPHSEDLLYFVYASREHLERVIDRRAHDDSLANGSLVDPGRHAILRGFPLRGSARFLNSAKATDQNSSKKARSETKASGFSR